MSFYANRNGDNGAQLQLTRILNRCHLSLPCTRKFNSQLHQPHDMVQMAGSTKPPDSDHQRALSASFHQLKMLSEVSGIRLYVQNDYLYSNENQHIFPMRSILNISYSSSGNFP